MILKIEAYHDGEMWCARGIGEAIFTQGETMDELIENVKEAVTLHFEDRGPLPEVMMFSEVSLTGAQLPQVSGDRVANLLKELGYEFARQRGSHARFTLVRRGESFHVTVPMHRVVAKGTLNDILNSVSGQTEIPKAELVERL